MQFIPGNLGYGQTCAVVPNCATDPDGFIHTHSVLPGWDREVFISAIAVKEMGRLMGMRTVEEVRDLETQLETLTAELAELSERVNDITKLRELEVKVLS